jgi:hypothetical protein
MSRRNKIIALVAVIVSIGIFTTIALYFGTFVLKVTDIEMDARVSNRIGFNTATDALHFGTVYPGGESNRQVSIANRNLYPVRVTVSNKGNISGYVLVETDFILPPLENRTIMYRFIAPEYHGNYTGASRIVVRRKLL